MHAESIINKEIMSLFALLIGINEYPQDSGLGSLKFAENDANKLAEVLENKCGFTTKTLIGSEATHSNIKKCVEQIEHGDGDTFVFYFAGHGQQLEGKYRLFPIDSKNGGFGSLLFEDFSTFWQRQSTYPKVLVLLDACRNIAGSRGSRSFEGMTSRDLDRHSKNNKLLEVIYGCSEGEQSWEDEKLKHGVFTHSLLQVFNGCQNELDTTMLSHKVNDVMSDMHKKLGHGRVQRVSRYYEPSERRRIVLFKSQTNSNIWRKNIKRSRLVSDKKILVFLHQNSSYFKPIDTLRESVPEYSILEFSDPKSFFALIEAIKVDGVFIGFDCFGGGELAFGLVIKISATSNIPIILIAKPGSLSRSNVIKAVKYGISDILASPFTSDDLFSNFKNNFFCQDSPENFK